MRGMYFEHTAMAFFGMKAHHIASGENSPRADLAEKSGVSREYIVRLETGHHDPSLSTLLKLAKALKVKVGDLLE